MMSALVSLWYISIYLRNIAAILRQELKKHGLYSKISMIDLII